LKHPTIRNYSIFPDIHKYEFIISIHQSHWDNAVELFVIVVMRAWVRQGNNSDMLAIQSSSAIRYLPSMFEFVTNAPPLCCCCCCCCRELFSEKLYLYIAKQTMNYNLICKHPVCCYVFIWLFIWPSTHVFLISSSFICGDMFRY
jgi:hypothetical protein